MENSSQRFVPEWYGGPLLFEKRDAMDHDWRKVGAFWFLAIRQKRRAPTPWTISRGRATWKKLEYRSSLWNSSHTCTLKEGTSRYKIVDENDSHASTNMRDHCISRKLTVYRDGSVYKIVESWIDGYTRRSNARNILLRVYYVGRSSL